MAAISSVFLKRKKAKLVVKHGVGCLTFFLLSVVTRYVFLLSKFSFNKFSFVLLEEKIFPLVTIFYSDVITVKADLVTQVSCSAITVIV